MSSALPMASGQARKSRPLACARKRREPFLGLRPVDRDAEWRSSRGDAPARDLAQPTAVEREPLQREHAPRRSAASPAVERFERAIDRHAQRARVLLLMRARRRAPAPSTASTTPRKKNMCSSDSRATASGRRSAPASAARRRSPPGIRAARRRSTSSPRSTRPAGTSTRSPCPSARCAPSRNWRISTTSSRVEIDRTMTTTRPTRTTSRSSVLAPSAVTRKRS